MSEEKKDPKEAKPTDDSASEEPSAEETAKAESTKNTKDVKVAVDVESKADAAAKAAETAEAAAQKAIAKAAVAKERAEAAAEAEYKAIADQVKADEANVPEHTFKRQGEEIFRREMGEPEFWLEKKDRFPRPILSDEEQAFITQRAEMFKDATPEYIPEHVLSPEFAGVSNYERAVDEFLVKAKQILEKLRADPQATKKQIKNAKHDITYLESLHENFFIGMNVFRTAKGGRSNIKS